MNMAKIYMRQPLTCPWNSVVMQWQARLLWEQQTVRICRACQLLTRYTIEAFGIPAAEPDVWDLQLCATIASPTNQEASKLLVSTNSPTWTGTEGGPKGGPSLILEIKEKRNDIHVDPRNTLITVQTLYPANQNLQTFLEQRIEFVNVIYFYRFWTNCGLRVLQALSTFSLVRWADLTSGP